jgi:hypothetical protein
LKSSPLAVSVSKVARIRRGLFLFRHMLIFGSRVSGSTVACTTPVYSNRLIPKWLR